MNQRQCRPFPPSTVAKIFAQITSAVAKMHRASPPIVHRDLKLENLLVEESGKNLRLCDFGSSTTEKFTPNENWNMSQRNNLEVKLAAKSKLKRLNFDDFFKGGDGQTYYTNVPCTGNVRHLVQLLHSYPG